MSEDSKNLLIINNISYGLTLSGSYKKVFFSPKFYSENQERFFKDLYHSFKCTNNLEWKDYIEDVDVSAVLCWDSDEEKKVFEEKMINYQNRLFEDIEFDFTDSFSNFRKKAEKKLPPSYSHAIYPQSDLVMKEIEYYFDEKKLAKSYFETRNGLVGRDFSTKFSAYLSCGALDVKYLYNRVKEFEKNHIKNKSTSWIIFELLWREFFYWHYQKLTTKYFSENGLKGSLDFSRFKDYEFDELRELPVHNFFYAALNELEETGYLSNRVRQIFASIWLNDLNLNWRSGAFLFERTLVDYDVYSNYGNWMYLAGVGGDPRGRRYFNVEKQLDMYDPDRVYMKKWL